MTSNHVTAANGWALGTTLAAAFAEQMGMPFERTLHYFAQGKALCDRGEDRGLLGVGRTNAGDNDIRPSPCLTCASLATRSQLAGCQGLR